MIGKNYLRRVCDNYKRKYNRLGVILLVKRAELDPLKALCAGWDDVDVMPVFTTSSYQTEHKDGLIHFCHGPAGAPKDIEPAREPAT